MPAADPLAGLRRAVGLDLEPSDPLSGLRAAVGAYGLWEPTRSPHVQRRRRPDGSYETRATPPAETLAPEGPLEPAVPERPIPPNIASALKAAGKTAPDIGAVPVPDVSWLDRAKAQVADAGYGWAVGAAEGVGNVAETVGGEGLRGAAERVGWAVPRGTREALREAALEAEESYLQAHPGSGGGPRIPFTETTVGEMARATAEGGQQAIASMIGPQLLLGPGLGGAAAAGARILGAGRGLATLAGAAGGAAEAAGQTYLDVVDLPPEEQARQVLLGAGLGTLGGAMAGRAPRAPDAPEPRLTPEALPATGRNAPNYSETIPGEKPANIIGLVSPPAPDAPFEAWLLREGWEPQDLTETQRGKLRQQFFRETDPAWAAQEAESAARVVAQQEERGRLLNRPEEPDLQPPARQEPTIPPEPPSPTGLDEIGPPRAVEAPIEAAAQARGRLRPVVRGQDRPWSPDEARPMVYFTHPGAGSEADALDLATAYQYLSPEGVTIQANLGPDLKIVSRRAHPELRNPHAAFEDGGERVAAILDDLGADAYVTREGGVPVIAVRREALGKLRNVQQLARGEVDDWRPLAFQSAAEEADVPVLARPEEEALAPGSSAPRMSTKALENVEGRKAEFHELVEQHRPEIEAARGPVKPASRWHDREGLARDLGMTTEDFLDSPAGRTWNDDEVSLGRHYLTGMRQEVGDLAGKLTRGEIPADQVEAAKARLAELEVDTVRMMATLQGSGFSTAARVLRSGQETLDPLGLASTPRAKLQLALLKHYGAKNAEEAAKIEQRAVARLKRQAAHEARKTGRAVTQEALSAEFQQLSSEFGKLSRTPRTGLDPELVALIGKMAANRVKAGVVAVEALADEIYQVARQHVEGIRREDVKAAIVEYTLAKPKARLARAEKAAAGSVEYLKGRVAGAPPAAGPTTSPWSARLGELKTRQAELREQLKRAPTERARKSEAAVSKAIERLEAAIAAGGAKPARRAPVTSPALEKLRARQAALRQQLTAMRKPPTDPAVKRIAEAERRTAQQIEKLQQRIAAGGAPKPSPTSSPWSAKLADLKAKQAAARKQLAALRKAGKPPKDPAAQKLVAREKQLERQVAALEKRIATGPQKPKPAGPAPDSPRLEELRRRAADLKAQIAKDPKEGLAARYRSLLDDELVARIAALSGDPESPDLLNFIRSMEKPHFRDYAGAIAYNNILSAPKSLIKNVVGNTIKRWDRVVMHPLVVGVEAVLAPLQGRQRERYMREVVPMVVGLFAGVPEGLRKALFVLKQGYDPERLLDDLTGARKMSGKYYETGHLPVNAFVLAPNRAARIAGAIHGYGPRVMQVGDVMSRARASTAASYAWATRHAIMDVKAGRAADVGARAAELLQEQPEEMLEYAQRIAREDTFTDEVSNIAKSLAAIRRDDSGAGFVATQLYRFLSVPDRVAAWLADYTPGLRIAGAAWKGGKLRKAWGTPEASEMIARQIFGTTLAAAATAWAFQGKLTGANPQDENLRNDAYAVGKQPWSALVNGEHWVPIRDLFGGWAAPVVAAVAFVDNARTGAPVDGEEILRRAGGAALGEARYLLDAGYLSGLADTVSAIQAEPDQAGREAVGIAARLGGGAVIPWSGAQRNVAIWQDPRVVEKEGFLDELKAGIPGLREQLPARLDTDGDPLVMTTGAAGGVSPIVPTESQLADPVLAEKVERLRYTLTSRRTELRHLEERLANARTLKDAPRAREIMKQLPRGVTTADLDGTMKEIRALEQEIRALRKSKAPEERRKAVEIKKQQRMAQILEQALGRLGGGE